MKESKQKGTPLKLSKKRTALVNFTPETEVSKYKGAPLRTSSGIRGQINEAAKREEIAKCTFRCRISMSDIVFMRVWRQVEAPRFFNPSTTLEQCDSIVPVNKDSLNKDNPAQRRVELKQRRRVKIIDGVPCLYTCSNPLTVLYNLEYMNKNKKRKIKKKKNEVISEEEQKEYERGAEMSKRHQEEDEKAFTSGVPMMVLEDWD
ncbi:ribosome biogenesis protein BMS1-like [Papaver somniferum]|uniref:ribosome biogenesis protein BMS1-like n=1 Tax=Papaver somniferum TaxID=3469 RepID=UPI000E6F8DA0|nr:ribosome biogenesis protein BMS1-like [Papaver somniferum]